jgi:flagellar basal-body rod protein FlgB
MYDSLDVFRMSSAMARHAAARQAVVATNLANADSPGYRARALPDFSTVWDGGSRGMRATRSGHAAPQDGLSARAAPRLTEPSPNGNSVSIESEMLAAIEAQREHGRALAIWRHATGLLRTSLGR